MNRSTIGRALPALAAMLLLVGTGTFAAAGPAVAGTGSRDSLVGVALLQNGSSSGITVGGQLQIGVNIGDDSGSCINFADCDNPLGTVDVVLQNADLSYNRTIATLNLSGVVHDASQGGATIDNPLPPGKYHVDAHYNGDPNFHPNDGTLDNVVVSALTPDVGISQSSTSSYQGDGVTFSASVSSPNGVHPTGTVQLIYGTTPIGGPLALDSSGNASVTRTDLPLSDSSGHTYYFHYSGDTFLNPADSASLDHQTLATTPTTTTITVPTPVRQDDPEPVSAGVSAAGGVHPPGTVRFTALLGGTLPVASTTGTLSGGVATGSFAANTLLVGVYRVVARYQPTDPSYAVSSAGTSLVVTPAIPLAGLVLTVSAAPSPGVLGAPETLHVVATAPSGSTAAAAGVIGIVTGATALGACTLVAAGPATTTCDLTTTALPAGVDPVTATFPGSSHFTAVSGSTSVTITEPSSTTLTATPTTATAGDPVTLTAQVSPAQPVAGEPTGTVDFRDGATLLGTASVDASGTATLTTDALPVGARALVAYYSGDAVVDQSQSAPVTVTITAVTSSASPTAPPSSGHAPPSKGHPTGSPSGHPASGGPTSGPTGGHHTGGPTSTTGVGPGDPGAGSRDPGAGTAGGNSSGSGSLAGTGVRRLEELITCAAILLALGAALTGLGRRSRPLARHR